MNTASENGKCSQAVSSDCIDYNVKPVPHVVWRSRPFTKRCAGERVWNHAIHRVVTRSSIPAPREYHYRARRPREYHYRARRPTF